MAQALLLIVSWGFYWPSLRQGAAGAMILNPAAYFSGLEASEPLPENRQTTANTEAGSCQHAARAELWRTYS